MRSVLAALIILLVLGGCQPELHPTSTPVSETPLPATPTFTVATTPTVGSTVDISSVSEYLKAWPAPGKTYSITDYQKLAPSLQWGATVPGICVYVWPFPFLDPGDFPTTEEWLDRIRLVVDSESITEYHSILMTDSFGREITVDTETDKLHYREPDGSPYSICYAVSLGIGRHAVAFAVEKSHGEEIAVTWEFTLVE